MQVTTGGQAGAADVADDLPLPDLLSGSDHVTGCMVEASRSPVPVDDAMVEHQPVAVAPLKYGGADPASPYGARIGAPQAAPKSVPSWSFQTPEHGMEAHAETPRRCHR